MSLQYVIDGYNIINHPRFIQQANKKTKHNNPAALLELIRRNKLCGSLRNKVTVVFDGYPDKAYEARDFGIGVIFSRDDTADERIKKILETSNKTNNVIVVSDDKEIKFFAKSCGAKAMSVEDFIPLKESMIESRGDSTKPELTYTQAHKINEELRKIWLK